VPKRDPIDLINAAVKRRGWTYQRLVDELFNGSKPMTSHYMNRRMRLPPRLALRAKQLLGTTISEQALASYTINPYPSAGKR
jgi:hypothetical protein